VFSDTLPESITIIMEHDIDVMCEDFNYRHERGRIDMVNIPANAIVFAAIKLLREEAVLLGFFDAPKIIPTSLIDIMEYEATMIVHEGVRHISHQGMDLLKKNVKWLIQYYVDLLKWNGYDPTIIPKEVRFDANMLVIKGFYDDPLQT
jgi:hypothetical protein